MISVSVIIPLYNVEKDLRQCLDSVLNQTLKDIEIICVDDCSTDSSGEIIAQYAEKYANITCLKTDKNYGTPGQGRNMGMDIAKGEYIGFVDADDYISENYYEALYSSAKEHNADVALCSCMVKFNADGVLFVDNYEDPTPVLDTPEKKEYRMSKSGFNMNKIYRKSFVQSYGLRCYEQRVVAEDNFFTSLSMALANKIIVDYRGTYFYRKHAGTMSSGTRSKKDFLFFDVYKKIDDTLETYIARGLVSPKYRALMDRRKFMDCYYFLELCEPDSVKAFKAEVRRFFPPVAHKLGFTPLGALELWGRNVLSPVKQGLLRRIKKIS